MIKERYCSPEVAKLLKEKGFNIPVWTRYEDDGKVIFGDKYNWNNSPNEQISAPTHQMTIDWLREVHNIHIGINPISENGYNATIYDVADLDDYGIISGTESFFHVEQAVEAAIKYCLENLI